jgi:glycine/D-amino acid oxidase-like deaminating enzyme
MRKNHSPWLYQLRQDRVSQGLHQDVTADIAIIGAGIAGISTAFFILKNTNRNVTIFEGYKLAHGATGHNAGQVVSYFERGFASLVEEFGLERAADGQKAVEDAWELLDIMYNEAGLKIPFSRFLGHAGLSSYEQVLLHLKNNSLRKKANLKTEQILISEQTDFLNTIPEEYAGLYQTVPHAEILSILETKENSFVAVISYQKGCINSALFCEEVLVYLLKKYPDRFFIFEHTKINKIVLRHTDVVLDAGDHTAIAQRIILCTNGFAGITILNETGLDINTKFHHLVHGTVGYMSGYLEKMNKPPTAISYLTDPDPSTDDPYFYLTRRAYEYEGDKDYNLISIGGPEAPLEDSRQYSKDNDYPDETAEMIDTFVRDVYNTEPNKKIDYIFTWHGLMGYTKNGIRLIGPEPKNNVLLYNLGCNGIGILPSVYGGQRISEFISEKPMNKSIFDVPAEYNA